ncbi:hypothetical protein ARMGADRAFT_1048756 [Armillaria gallica]|uniref:Uncharacterized protein n=1 Tax=Armillaria gallica TaxID=47427 RepID=A0A2H3D0F6_ARMGA|nr:hypothetical protein ARMGADRAFT_1048756 [Armillaria gallica]
MLPTPRVQCQYCPRSFARCGLNRHQTACKRKFDEQQDNALYEQQLFSTTHFEDYRSSPAFQHVEPPIDPHPWRPFASRRDFELAELILDAALMERQMKTMFRLLNPDSEAESSPSAEFNIHSPKEFKEHWDRAANLITPICKDYTYDVYRRNLWAWALELIQNPMLEPHFVWDAVQLSKWNGHTFERFVDEPWTVQAFWDLQTALPEGAKVLYFIIYADKTRLSSFGTAQGYPVITHCGNLLIDIRNGNGVGGGCVIRWLPVIKEEAKFRKKVYYVDFKRRVWHAAFKYILEPLFMPSRTGGWVHLCLAKTDIQMFPRVPIKSCDYDEANFVVLIRGANGLKPCVVCLVPKLEQYNLDIIYELRTKRQTQEILTDAAAIPTKGAQNKFLSGFGLRNIENAFWNIEDCDPFHALSFDPLHAHDNGLFGDHLRCWKFIGQADDQIKLFPHWRNLYHFESGFMAVHFADSGKYEDLSKEYEQLTWSIDPGAKSWNFPKVHSHQHMVDDILQKGVTLNYNTKPNEKMHGPLKDAYQLRTNFKDVAEQQIDLHDEQLKNQEMSGNNNDELEDQDTSVSEYSGKVTLHGHRGKGGGFAKYDDIVPKVNGKKVSFKLFKPDEEIQLHGLLKVNYENMVDWTTSTDYLRCSQNFYNHSRYDFLLVDSTERPFFAQLIMIFTCVIAGKSFPLALVHPFNQPLDKDLGFYRVRARKRSESTFMSVYMIIRGALLVEDFGDEIT